MDRSKTVIDTKSAFLRAQIRWLSAVLQPSAQWRDFSHTPEEGDLSDKIVDEAMGKVNEKFKMHNKAVYSAPSQRHVAEQIDALYWNDTLKNASLTNGGQLVVSKDTDLTTSEAVEELPVTYGDLRIQETDDDPESASAYRDLRERLDKLCARRDEQTRRVALYRQLESLLQPFENAKEDIQPNLATKDGELARELERMRILLARVTGEVQNKKASSLSEKKSVQPAPNEKGLQTERMDLS